METAQNSDLIVFPLTTRSVKFRSSVFWMMIVKILSPIFAFVWEYGINFRRKIVAFSYPKPNLNFYSPSTVKTKGIEIISNHKPYIEFASYLRANISAKVLEQTKQKLLADSNPEAFFTCIEMDLPEEVRYKLLEFALSADAMAPAIDYLGVVPRIVNLMVLYNVPKNGEGQVGSKEWHRDDSRYKALNLFMCISDVDDESGAYYAIPHDQIERHAVVPLEKIDLSQSVWLRYRHSFDLIKKYVPHVKPVKLEGTSGTAALVDPGSLYHRGGHCTKKDRIMLQINYALDTPEAYSSIIERYKLTNHPRVNELQNTLAKKLATNGNEKKLFWLLGVQNPVYLVGRRILSYFLKSNA